MWDERTILEQKACGYDGIIKYKAKYKGYTVYAPYSTKGLALGPASFFLVKGDNIRSTYHPSDEFLRIVRFLQANDNFPQTPHIPD